MNQSECKSQDNSSNNAKFACKNTDNIIFYCVANLKSLVISSNPIQLQLQHNSWEIIGNLAEQTTQFLFIKFGTQH